MADKTVVARARRQRHARVAEGWEKLTVWVPTKADARDVKLLAAERRAGAERLESLSREVPKVPKAVEVRLAEAIAKEGTGAYADRSGAVLELLTHLADEDDLRGFARAVVIIARAKPANAALLVNAVPGKISNFLIKKRGVEARGLVQWANANAGWSENLKEAVRDPELFEAVVEAMATGVKRTF